MSAPPAGSRRRPGGSLTPVLRAPSICVLLTKIEDGSPRDGTTIYWRFEPSSWTGIERSLCFTLNVIEAPARRAHAASSSRVRRCRARMAAP